MIDVNASPPAFILDHVAIGVDALAPCALLLEDVLGAEPDSGGPSPNFTYAQWRFSGDARLELLEPRGEPGFLHRFLDQRGPGIHHVTFKVPNLEQAAAWARVRGYEVVGYDDRFPSWKECFLHPKQAQGIVVQFAESHPELEPPSEWPVTRQPSARVAVPGQAARLRAVRLSARSQADADHQWKTLLGAQSTQDALGTLYCWPKSPLSIRVCVDPSAVPGPIGLEIVTPQPVALPETELSKFGTRFLCD